MHSLTIKSTVRKDQLPNFLCDIKKLFERSSQSLPEDLHIKNIYNEHDDDYCEVTVNSLPSMKHSVH